MGMATQSSGYTTAPCIIEYDNTYAFGNPYQRHPRQVMTKRMREKLLKKHKESIHPKNLDRIVPHYKQKNIMCSSRRKGRKCKR